MAFKIENGVLKDVYDVNGTEIIYIPDNVKTIASHAFNGLTITEVFVPDSVELIQKGAFLRCNIEKISIPENIDITGIVDNRIKSAFGELFCWDYEGPEIERRKRNTKTTVVEEMHKTDYKQLFLDALYAKGNADMEKIFDNIYDDDVKIPVAVYFFTAYEIEKAEEYISANFQKVMHYLVDKQDINGINAVMSLANKE